LESFVGNGRVKLRPNRTVSTGARINRRLTSFADRSSPRRRLMS
jgi:hypothetical protein